ncbi:unnamed protein product [Vitrella brassicaformis CCMP3155]|uniref:Uncharacterized protein n=2 Tax=Vitrella brassicaformis TaxID=1169539 RepID=A0A0G4ESJ9_VITBC|nr:unnamed protein product [Vitrella brassicaformis CCMP3155]|eukprot:CEM00972.1 unnamed protein product [Vitrella brassicaformis CCMP3155]
MHFVVMLQDGGSFALTIGLVLVVIAANLAHYIALVTRIWRFGLLQVAYRYTALTDRKTAIARLMSGCLAGPLVSWLIHTEENRRQRSPKVFYDWSTAALSVDGPPTAASAASGKCDPSFGRPMHRVVAAMQLTSAAIQDAVETLKVTHVPSDFHEFLWSHAGRSEWRWTADDKASSQHSVVSPGITLYDLHANLAYVVDELVTREQLRQAALQKADGSDLERGDGKEPPDEHHHGSGGWRGLYEAFRKAKQSLIDAGSQPEAVPEVLATLAATAVDTPHGDDALWSLSPVSSSSSRPQSDPPAAVRAPLCHLTRVDWHRLTTDIDNTVAAMSVSTEALYDACSALSARDAANTDD